jgi:hypothetical protein
MLREFDPDISDAQIDSEITSNFATWFRGHVSFREHDIF